MSSSSLCPICQHEQTQQFLVCRDMPVFCNVLSESRAAARALPRGDISLAFCQRCCHIYNATFDQSLMSYDVAYENSLHFSPRFQTYASELVAGILARHNLKGKRVVDIGAGRGDFLRLLVAAAGAKGIALDPSLLAHSGSADIEHIQDHFSEAYTDLAADFVVCRHVLEHIETPISFLRLIKRAMNEGDAARLFLEVPDAAFTIRQNGIWDIIYEHFSYFTEWSLAQALQSAGFVAAHIQHTFGQQFLVAEGELGRAGEAPTSAKRGQEAFRAEIDHFADHFAALLARWRDRLAPLGSADRVVVIWGAGSKGATFINLLAETDAINYAVDISPRKRGKYVAGSGQEIIAPAALPGLEPELIIIMNPNYEAEIRAQVREMSLNSKIEVV